MPFDSSNPIDSTRSIISALVHQADDALAMSNRAGCIEIIEQIYSMLDETSAACVVHAIKPSAGVRRDARRLRA